MATSTVANGFIRARKFWTQLTDFRKASFATGCHRAGLAVLGQVRLECNEMGRGLLSRSRGDDRAAARHARAKLMVSVWSKIDPVKQRWGNSSWRRGTTYQGRSGSTSSILPPRKPVLEKLSASACYRSASTPGGRTPRSRKTTISPEDRLSTGPGEKVRLLFPLFVNKTVYEGQRKDAPDKRVFILSRSAFLGQQRYASVDLVGRHWQRLGHSEETDHCRTWIYVLADYRTGRRIPEDSFRPGPTQYN